MHMCKSSSEGLIKGAGGTKAKMFSDALKVPLKALVPIKFTIQHDSHHATCVALKGRFGVVFWVWVLIW